MTDEADFVDELPRLSKDVKDMRTLEPLYDYVIVVPIEKPELSTGGIMLLEESSVKGLPESTVLAVGPGVSSHTQLEVKMMIKPGDIVIHKRILPQNATPVMSKGQAGFLLRQSDIFAIIKE